MEITKITPMTVRIDESMGESLIEVFTDDDFVVGYDDHTDYNLSDFSPKEQILIFEELKRQVIEEIDSWIHYKEDIAKKKK